VSRVDKRKKLYKQQLHNAIDKFTTQMNILDLHIDCPEIYGAIRANLVSKGQDIGVVDCMIASQAMAYGYTLITHNTKHYQRIQKNISIKKLALED
jgi:tRNA(fMet)-specific endonuclease VapC